MPEAKPASISIFLSIIILSLIILSCSLMDLVRIHLVRSQNQQALTIASKSILADFDSQLLLEYGLFAFQPSNGLQGDYHLYYETALNLDHPLVGYTVEGLYARAQMPLSHPAVLEQQILDFMALRAPYALAEPILETFDFWGKATKTGQLLSLNYNVAIALEAMSGHFVELERYIDGVMLDGTERLIHMDGVPDIYPNFLKKWQIDPGHPPEFGFQDHGLEMAIQGAVLDLYAYGNWIGECLAQGKEATTRYISAYDQWSQLESQLLVIESQLEIINEVTEAVAWATWMSRWIDVFDALQMQEVTMMQQAQIIKEVQFQIKLWYEQGVALLIGPYQWQDSEFGLQGILLAAQEALDYIFQEMTVLEEQVGQLSDALESDPDHYVTGVHEQLQKDLVHYKDLLGHLQAEDGHYGLFLQMETVIQKNLKCLEDDIMPIAEGLQNGMEQLLIEVSRKTEAEVFLQALESLQTTFNQLIVAFKGYRTDVVFDYPDWIYEHDPMTREDFSAIANLLQLPSIDLTATIHVDDLPSGMAKSPVGMEMPYAGLTLDWGQSMWQALDFDLNAGIDSINDHLNQIYIHEYIYHTFNSFTTSYLENASNQHTLTRIKKENRGIDTELEYILFGHEALYANVAQGLAYIFALRVALNSFYIMASPEHMATVTHIANSLAGFWSLGIGTMAITPLIVLTWAGLESALDLNLLLTGRTVPIYKTMGTWQTDLESILLGGSMIQAGSDRSGSMGKVLELDYNDYLHLFLYLLPLDQERLLYRTMDVMELSFLKQREEPQWMRQAYTQIKGRSIVSIEPVLMPDLGFYYTFESEVAVAYD